MNELQKLQAAIHEWSMSNFGSQEAKHGSLAGQRLFEFAPLLGLAEELGELQAASTKGEAIDAMADIGVYLLDYCGRACVCLHDVIETTGISPDHYVTPPLGALVQGVGLLSRAHLKQAQGIRKHDNLHVFVQAQRKALAIIWLSLNRLAPTVDARSYFKDVLEPVALTVLSRNWVVHPHDANKKEGLPAVPGDVPESGAGAPGV